MFARTPELGAVKTRLQPTLGKEGCYRLHTSLVRNTVEVVLAADVAPVEIWHTGNAEHKCWCDIRAEFSVSLHEQKGADLGDRMLHAARADLAPQFDNSQPAEWVIIIGSDCPEIDDRYLQQAAELLEGGAETVIGPAEDGGYVLIGLRSPNSYLFDGVEWGTNKVLAQTLAKASDKKCQVHLLETLRDLDEPNDLAVFQSKITWINSAFPK